MKGKILKSILGLSAVMAIAAACSSHTVTVTNPLPLDRIGEVVEVPGEFAFGDRTVVTDGKGKQVPWQFSNEDKLLFPASVYASGSSTYKISKGKPEPFDTVCVGMHRPDRLDDFLWENEISGYRTYGPALQKTGERAFGYDIFTKSVTHPVMKDRFDNAIYGEEHLDFHTDHGDGMDSYAVGPTLGCGADALLDADGGIIYPWAWTDFRILDNGPIRFCAVFHYSPVEVEGAKVVETRKITLDSGSYLNKVEVSFSPLSGPHDLVAGVVVHPENPDAFLTISDDTGGYIGYADLGDRNIGKNGEIYAGVVFCTPLKDLEFRGFDKEESRVRGRASGHVLGTMEYLPGKTLTYYFGSGWSKATVGNLEVWEEILKNSRNCLQHPLEVTVDQ